MDIIKANKYSKPWKVIYETDWRTGELVLEEGKNIVNKVVDCNEHTIFETDNGYYEPNAEIAEYIIKCVNEREDE